MNFLKLICTTTILSCSLAVLIAQNSEADLDIAFEIKKHKFKNKSFPSYNWETIYGEKISSEDLKGHIVIINLWFVGCPPCMKEIPMFNDLTQTYKNQNVKFISLAPHIKDDLIEFNKKEASESIYYRARKIFGGQIINYPIVPYCDHRDKRKKPNELGIDCNQLQKEFKVNDFPTTFIIDKKGIVRHIKSGFPTDEKSYGKVKKIYQNTIDKLIEE